MCSVQILASRRAASSTAVQSTEYRAVKVRTGGWFLLGTRQATSKTRGNLKLRRVSVGSKDALNMAWCGGIDDGMRRTLCRSLEALLQRDRSFAQRFVKDRRALQRIVKLIVQETNARQLQHCSRLERSASLHCIVLAFRLTRIDEFAAELSLPILIAGALSGVVQYLPVSLHEGQERQQNPAGAQTSSSNNGNDDENFGQTKKINNNSSFWPSTSLSSAQELSAHAVVNPLVNGCAHGNFRWPCCALLFVCHPTIS